MKLIIHLFVYAVSFGVFHAILGNNSLLATMLGALVGFGISQTIASDEDDIG